MQVLILIIFSPFAHFFFHPYPRATLLNQGLVLKHGVSTVVVKNIVDLSSDAKDATQKGFEQEVSILWALNFHPNIVGFFFFLLLSSSSLSSLSLD